jgi:hypothetical protein
LEVDAVVSEDVDKTPAMDDQRASGLAIRWLSHLPSGKSRLARRDLLVEHAVVSGAHEPGGEPVGPPLVVDHDASPRGLDDRRIW